MTQQFPDLKTEYIKTEDFQDNPTTLTYKGFEYAPNEDDGPDSKKKTKMTWKQKLKYCLKYTYPEIATDEAGDPIMGNDGKPFVNRYYQAKYPHGYSVKYNFEEGSLETGSLPLFKRFCQLQPTEGERITLLRTGVDKETKWTVTRAKAGVPSAPPADDISDDELADFART